MSHLCLNEGYANYLIGSGGVALPRQNVQVVAFSQNIRTDHAYWSQMAAEASLFPDVIMGSSQSDMLKDDLFLQDLINNQGVQVRKQLAYDI